jgi:hypothetical protein
MAMDLNSAQSALKTLRILGYVSLLFFPFLLLGGIMAFDAPGSERGAGPIVVMGFLAAYLILPFLAPPIARRVLAGGHARTAIAIAAVPISIFPALILIAQVASGVIGVIQMIRGPQPGVGI